MEDAPSPCEDWEQEYELDDVTKHADDVMSKNPHLTWDTFRDEVRYRIKNYSPKEFTCIDCNKTFATRTEFSMDLCPKCAFESSTKAWAKHPKGFTIDYREGK